MFLHCILLYRPTCAFCNCEIKSSRIVANILHTRRCEMHNFCQLYYVLTVDVVEQFNVVTCVNILQTEQ